MAGYVYKLTFKLTGQYYIGCRYAQYLTEQKIKSDLWVSYFTSSKIIKHLINEHGKDAFEPKIIKIFDSGLKAKEYEQKLLKRINADTNEKMLNQSISTGKNAPRMKWVTNGKIDTMINVSKPVLFGFRPGRSQNKGHRHPSKLTGRIHIIDEHGNHKMISKEDYDPEKHKKKSTDNNSGRIWINNPATLECTLINPSDPIPDGWELGNPHRRKTSWYHDPNTKQNIQIKQDDSPPAHLIKGRYYPKRWFTNKLTKENVLCIPGTEPAGFTKGRTI